MSCLEDFFQQFPVIDYQAGSFLLRSNEQPEHIFAVASGLIRQYVIAPNGQELTLQIYRKPSYFYLSWVFNKVPNHFEFEALTAAKVHVIPINEVTRFMAQDSHAAQELLPRLFRGLDQMMDRLELFAFGNAMQKVVATLLSLHRRFPDSVSAKTIGVVMTHKEIGNLSGLTRETVSAHMSLLKKAGLLEMEGKLIHFPDLPALEQLANTGVD
jgi:CRP-like cAMP-binding protein